MMVTNGGVRNRQRGRRDFPGRRGTGTASAGAQPDREHTRTRPLKERARHREHRGNARGADFLQLDPAAAPARGLTAWLADALRTAIIDGHLAPGTALPATRVLAEELGISRGVIVEAYQRLREEGLAGARRRSRLPSPTGS